MAARDHLLIFGLGYTGRAVAAMARAAGWRVTAANRGAAEPPPGVLLLPFAGALPAIADATHVLATAPPGEAGDPVLARYKVALDDAPALRWAGYFSTTGVYGDRQGGWVDEGTPPAPANPRGVRRVAAEAEWAALGGRIAVDLFRLAGIYGPHRSVLDDVRGGHARRIIKPGHSFGRIHRDDIAAAVLAAMRQHREPGARVLNLTDDEPAESAAVVAEAARLLGRAPPPAVEFAAALASMSPMARSFWAESRLVRAEATKSALGLAWRHPSYREGLASILAEELAERGAEQRQV